jgi:hypothetical protein
MKIDLNSIFVLDLGMSQLSSLHLFLRMWETSGKQAENEILQVKNLNSIILTSHVSKVNFSVCFSHYLESEVEINIS